MSIAFKSDTLIDVKLDLIKGLYSLNLIKNDEMDEIDEFLKKMDVNAKKKLKVR